jgi:hypothetical protein
LGKSQNQQGISGDPNRLQPSQSILGGIGLPASGGGGLPIQTVRISKKRLDDKKTCRWVLDNGTLCGKTFSKFDSLRRHVQELHKGVRPHICSLCEKSYGRRDYLDRHLKTHTAEALMIGDTLVGGHSGSCSVSVSVCDDDMDGNPPDDDDEDDMMDVEEDDDDLSPNLTSVVTVISTDD